MRTVENFGACDIGRECVVLNLRASFDEMSGAMGEPKPGEGGRCGVDGLLCIPLTKAEGGEEEEEAALCLSFFSFGQCSGSDRETDMDMDLRVMLFRLTREGIAERMRLGDVVGVVDCCPGVGAFPDLGLVVWAWPSVCFAAESNCFRRDSARGSGVRGVTGWES